MKQKTEIESVRIEKLSYGELYHACEGVTHTKVMPVLSVVQAIEGSYDIGLDGAPPINTGEGGAFVAPAHILQKIVHHVGASGKMRAHWTFIDAVVNDAWRIDELFSFPAVLDEKYNREIERCISDIANGKNCFKKMQSAYRILEILVEVGTPRMETSTEKEKIAAFVQERYGEAITAKEIAEHLYCSTAQVFRYTKKFFGTTPAHYVNGVRMQRAEAMLRNTGKTVSEIAASVGVFDTVYFTKVFKKHYGATPTAYRKQYSAKK